MNVNVIGQFYFGLCNFFKGNNYYPFGMVMPARYFSSDNYRFGFNGKLKDDEVKGVGNSIDFGARIYDPRLNRWLSVDPLQAQYAGVSPFIFALNTPIQAKDPDGNLVIFVNGFRTGAFQDYILNPFDWSPPWNDSPLYTDDWLAYGNYWQGYNWSESKANFVDRFEDYNDIYVDGMYSPQSTAQERYDRGVADANALIEKINSREIEYKAGETIKVVGHSQGGWHSEGMADGFAKGGYPVEGLYLLNPHGPNQEVVRLTGVPDYFSAQYSRMTDCVSSDQSCLEGLNINLYGGPGMIVSEKIPFGDWLVGDSEYKEIPGVTEFFQLKDLPQAEKGGHYVGDTAPEVLAIPAGNKGYVRDPKK